MSQRGEKLTIEQCLDGTRWLFLCFTPERLERLGVMIGEAIKETGRAIEIGHCHIQSGVLWNGAECRAIVVAKDQIDRATLFAGLRKHFGYEMPADGDNVFTIGITPEEDALLDQVGLFGKGKEKGV
jgi:hypothetical protein